MDNSKKGSIDEIKASLINDCKLSTSVLLDAFHARRKRSDESYSKYGKLQGLLTRAMPSINDQEKVSFLRSQLVKFSTDQLRLMVTCHSDKKWEDLLTSLDQANALTSSDIGVYEHLTSDLCHSRTETTELECKSTFTESIIFKSFI